MSKRWRKLIAVLMTVCMICGLLPFQEETSVEAANELRGYAREKTAGSGRYVFDDILINADHSVEYKGLYIMFSKTPNTGDEIFVNGSIDGFNVSTHSSTSAPGVNGGYYSVVIELGTQGDPNSGKR